MAAYQIETVPFPSFLSIEVVGTKVALYDTQTGKEFIRTQSVDITTDPTLPEGWVKHTTIFENYIKRKGGDNVEIERIVDDLGNVYYNIF